jgi:hypothetical protein
VAIAHQPVTAPIRITTRPTRSRVRYGTAAVRGPARAWTVIRLAALVAATALCVALAVAVVVGSALFALLSFAG